MLSPATVCGQESLQHPEDGIPDRQSSSLSVPLPKARGHVQLAIHRSRESEILMGVFWLACPAVELTQTEVAVGDERAHAVQAGEYQCLPVVRFAAFKIVSLGIGRDVAEQVQSMGR